MDSLILVKLCPPTLRPGARTVFVCCVVCARRTLVLGTASSAFVGLLVSSTVFDDLLWDLAIFARSSDDTDEC